MHIADCISFAVELATEPIIIVVPLTDRHPQCLVERDVCTELEVCSGIFVAVVHIVRQLCELHVVIDNIWTACRSVAAAKLIGIEVDGIIQRVDGEVDGVTIAGIVCNLHLTFKSLVFGFYAAGAAGG